MPYSKSKPKKVSLQDAFSPRESDTPKAMRADLDKTYSKERLERREKLMQRIAGKNTVLTLGNINAATDGSYLLLTQQELIENKTTVEKALEDILNIHLILDVEADESGVLNLDSDLITTPHLHLIDSAKNIKIIGQSFLVTNKAIQHITFSGFKAVRTIESGFMLGCSKLKSADLSSLESLAIIKDCFMSEATSLTHLNLPTTRFFNAKLKTVGNHFLRGAFSLTTIQEEAFESVTSMGGYFMSQSALQSFNTAKLKDLAKLGEAFLAKCDSLITVDVSGLKCITPALVAKADVEVEALKNHPRHNLGVMHGCDELGKKLNGIRGVETLPRALRTELAHRFGRQNWIEIEAGCCGL
jgi:hypothetical protein